MNDKQGLFGDVVKASVGKFPCVLVEVAEGYDLVLDGARADDNVALRAVFFDASLVLENAKSLANDLPTGAFASAVTSGYLVEADLPAGTRHFLANENLLVSDPDGFPIGSKLLLFGADNGKNLFASVKLREVEQPTGSPAE